MSALSETTDASWYPKEKMSVPKAAEVVKVIKDALILKQISYRSLFVKLDSNGNGLLSFAEFSNGMDQIVSLSPVVKQ